MPYDSDHDPWAASLKEKNDFGRSARVIEPSDTVDFEPYAKLVVLTEGTLVVIPIKNADGTPITFGSLPAGTLIPWACRRVLDTGTSATVATVDH
jgi:hypothetical protein